MEAQSQHTLLRSVLSRSVGESTDEVVVVDLVFSMRAHSDELQVRDRRLLSAPHPEVRREGREPLPDHAGESTLLREQERSRSSEEVVPGRSVFPSREPEHSLTYITAGSSMTHLPEYWK